jgi:urease accessory protein
VLSDLHMSGSAKLMFPRARSGTLDAVFLNSAGGVTGGDVFSLAATLGPATDLRMTTQAAERVYRAVPGAPGRVETRLTLGAGARLFWLPQETILYDGGALDRRLRVEMAPDARLLACETLLFGRGAMGETVRQLHLRDRIDLAVDGQTVFADRLRLDGDAQAQLDLAGVAGGARAMASLLLAGPGAAARLETIRAGLPDTAGASALSETRVFVRLLARDGFALRASLVPLLRMLAQADLPRPWLL